MGLFILTIVLAAVSFWVGFIAAPHPWQYKSKAGFVVFTGLALFTGYFALREHRTVAELARLIEPVPQITDVTYVPTPDEMLALARAAAAVPGRGAYGLGSTPEQRRDLARDVEQLEQRYWLLETELTPEEVARFYREAGHRRDWTVTVDEPPWLGLERRGESLMIFVRGGYARSDVLYVYAVDGD